MGSIRYALTSTFRVPAPAERRRQSPARHTRRRGARDLPFTDWGSEFHERMPPVIAAAIEASMPTELAMDSTWKEVGERFWDRLQQMRIRLRNDASSTGGQPVQSAPKVTLPGGEDTQTHRPRLPRLAGPRDRTPDLVVTDMPAGTAGASPTSRPRSRRFFRSPPRSSTSPTHSRRGIRRTSTRMWSRGCVYLKRPLPHGRRIRRRSGAVRRRLRAGPRGHRRQAFGEPVSARAARLDQDQEPRLLAARRGSRCAAAVAERRRAAA